MNQLRDVDDFHAKMNLHYPDGPRVVPGELPEDVVEALRMVRDELRRIGREDTQNLIAFRVGFMLEELIEFADAHRAEDLEAMLDALVDLDYVQKGTVHLAGFGAMIVLDEGNVVGRVYEEAWRRVHEKNMQKELAPVGDERSKRGTRFDVVKPEGWTPPAFDDLVRPRGDDADVMREIERSEASSQMSANGVTRRCPACGSSVVVALPIAAGTETLELECENGHIFQPEENDHGQRQFGFRRFSR